VVAAGTSGRVLLRKGMLGRKMSPNKYREYSMEMLQQTGARDLSLHFVSCSVSAVSHKTFSLEKFSDGLYQLVGIFGVKMISEGLASLKQPAFFDA
jgi:hypothetical protein